MVRRFARDPSKVLAAAALACWALALALPVARITTTPACTGPSTVMMGYLMLLIGWLGPLQLQVAWYANPLILVAIVRRLTSRGRGWWGLCALLVAIPSLLWVNATADTPGYVCGHRAGFYLWLGSSCLLAVADGLDRSRRGAIGAKP